MQALQHAPASEEIISAHLKILIHVILDFAGANILFSNVTNWPRLGELHDRVSAGNLHICLIRFGIRLWRSMLYASSPADYLMPASENPFVLVIEDDAFVGIELYEVVLHEGFRVVGSICTNATALTWIANGTAALAIAAMKLNDGPPDDVMRTLRGRGVPFLIHAESEHAGSRPDLLRGVADQARLAPGRDQRAERSSSQVGPET